MKKLFKSPLKHLLTLSLLIFYAHIHAQEVLDHPCKDLEQAQYQSSLKSCQAHLACQTVLNELKSCPRSTLFLKKIGERIGQGRPNRFFGTNTDARIDDVWYALAETVSGLPLTDKKWIREVALLDESTFNESDIARGADGSMGSWIFWGKSSNDTPSGQGVHLEVNIASLRLMRGNFQGRTTQGMAEVIKFDGNILSRQIGIFEAGRLKPMTETLVINEAGLLMMGRFDEALTTFEGTIDQADRSRLKGTYQVQTGDGQLEVYRPDGSLKEKGQFKAHKLYMGERFNESGQTIEVINNKKIDEARAIEEAKVLKLEQARVAAEKAQAEENAKKEEKEMRLNFERWTAGQLFAFADEAFSEGKYGNARTALRTLLRRFSDHALAAQAAALLGRLATDTQKEPNTSVGNSSPQLTALKCEDSLIQLEKEQQEIMTQTPILAPYASYRRTIQFANQRLQLMEKRCPSNIKNQILKEQLLRVIAESEQACRKVAVDEHVCSRDAIQ